MIALKEIKQVINNELKDILKPRGFKINRSSGNRFEMQVQDSIKLIRLNYYSTNRIKPDFPAICLNEVYEFMSMTKRPYYRKPSKEVFKLREKGGVLYAPKGWFEGTQTIYIETTDQLLQFKSKVSDYLENIALPFFEENTNPYKALVTIKRFWGERPYVNQVLRFANPTVNYYYMLTIMKLCDDPEFELWLEKSQNHIANLDEDYRGDWKKSFDAFLKRLQKQKPIYKDMYENVF